MSDPTRYGAYPGDWAHLDLVCELTEDLLPVVSNPNAKKSPESKIAGPGKTPSRYNGHGEMSGFMEWTQHRADGEDITRWSKVPDYGICIQTRRIRAIDVDVDDADEADRIFRAIGKHISGLPLRNRADSSKFLLAFELVGDFTKRRFKTAGGVIEFLATGQQFVACGTHPKGARYEWPDGLPAMFPTLTAEQFEAIWVDLNKQFGIEESVEISKGMSPTVKRQAADAKDPTVQFLVDNWTVHSIDRSGRVDIVCPFEEEHTTDSGPSATSYFPAGVGGFDQGHFKCQHSHCAHRANGDFIDAIGIVAAEFDVIVEAPKAPGTAVAAPIPRAINQARKVGGKNDGKITATRAAVLAAIGRPDMYGYWVGFDKCREELMVAEVKGDTMAAKRPFRDSDYYKISIALEDGKPAFEHVPTEMVRAAVEVAAEQNVFDSAQEWLTSLRWDGKPRVRSFLHAYFGSEDAPYNTAVSLYWWSGQAGRVMQPGIKADMAPIAVGSQGAGKTSAVMVMAPTPSHFLELDLTKSDDDLAREMRGRLVVEIGEMKGSNTRQVEHTKSFLSRTTEKWVPKYKEFTTEYPRRCMFFGTANGDEPLPDDDTGHRRWLPFTVVDDRRCKPDAIARDRDQLWAEALVLFNQHGIMWEDAEKLGKHVHRQYQKDDSWQYLIEEWLFFSELGETPPAGREAGLQIHEILIGALALRPEAIGQVAEKRAGKCLRVLGFKKVNRNNKKVWVKGS